MPSHSALPILCVVLALAPATLTAQPIATSEPFRISPLHPGEGETRRDYEPGVTALAGGGFATAWAWTLWRYGSLMETGLSGRLLDPAGLGPASFDITTSWFPYDHDMNCPVLAPLPGGGFALADSEFTMESWYLFLGTFDADGSPEGRGFLRFLDEGVGDFCPAMASRPDGGFVLTWPEVHYREREGVRTVTRSFDAAGAPLGPETYLDDLSNGRSQVDLPAVGTDGQGHSVVVWHQPGSPLRAQHLDRDGTPLGDPVVVAGTSAQGHAVAVAPDGGFAVAWTGSRSKLSFPLLLRRFAADGTPLGPPVEAMRTSGDFDVPSTAVDRHGNFALTWGGHLLLINRSLVPQGPPVSAGSSDWNRLALNGDGRLLMVWASGEARILGRFWRMRREADLCLARGGRFLCDTAGDGGTAEILAFGRGLPFDVPLLGDADGDGRADPCVWRNGAFLCDTAHDGGRAEVRLRFGHPGDSPLLGDLDGDGRADPCVWRTGSFLCDTGHDGGGAETAIHFGPADGVPLLADLDGDGRADPCVWKGGRLLGDTSHNGGRAERVLTFRPGGNAGGIPLLGDVDGDRRADLCLLRDATLFCGHFAATGGAPLARTRRGTAARAGDVPLLGDLDAF